MLLHCCSFCLTEKAKQRWRASSRMWKSQSVLDGCPGKESQNEFWRVHSYSNKSATNKSMCMCVHMCVLVCMSVSLYVHVPVCTYMYANMSMCAWVHVFTYVHALVCLCVYMHISTHVCICVHVWVWVCMCVCECTYPIESAAEVNSSCIKFGYSKRQQL